MGRNRSGLHHQRLGNYSHWSFAKVFYIGRLMQVRKKGSQSAKVLRDKAVMLRVALEETAAEFCLDMPE